MLKRIKLFLKRKELTLVEKSAPIIEEKTPLIKPYTNYGLSRSERRRQWHNSWGKYKI